MILEGDPCVCENGDPLRPTLGAYLVGPPGAGKTHIMAAFGLLGTVLTAGLLLLAAGRLASVSGLLWGGAAPVLLIRLWADGWSPAVLVVLAIVAAVGAFMSSMATEKLFSYR